MQSSATVAVEAKDYNARSTGGRADWRDEMRRLAHERAERYETILCGEFMLGNIPIGETVILGTFSCTWLHRKARYLKRKFVVDIGFGPQSPGDVARDYLVAKFGRATPDPVSRRPPDTDFQSMPAFAKPGKYKDVVYLDVSGAYWSIMRRMGWSVAYLPGQSLGRGGSVADFPLADHKLARNMLVSIGLPSKIYMLTHWGPKNKKAYNRLLNGHLWRLVSDTLHTLACYAHDECGAVYFLTDGAIMPAEHAERYIAYAARLGLTVRYDSMIGRGHIKAVGCYKLPGKKTKNFARYDPRPAWRLRAVDPFLASQLEKFGTIETWPTSD